MSRAGYKFPKELKEERAEIARFLCEQCGQKKPLYFHHLIPCYFASQNPALTPTLVRSLENCQALCSDCHKKADENLFMMSTHDLAMLAWGILGVSPAEVVAQHGIVPPVKKKKRHAELERKFTKEERREMRVVKRERRKKRWKAHLR